MCEEVWLVTRFHLSWEVESVSATFEIKKMIFMVIQKKILKNIV